MDGFIMETRLALDENGVVLAIVTKETGLSEIKWLEAMSAYEGFSSMSVVE